MQVEDVTGVLCDSVKVAETEIQKGNIAIMVDEKAECIHEFQPDVVVDAILAKRNLGTKITDAPFVVGVGPGFTAGEDCHCVVETSAVIIWDVVSGKAVLSQIPVFRA